MDTDEQNFCPSCGLEIRFKLSVSCAYCGAKLRETKETKSRKRAWEKSQEAYSKIKKSPIILFQLLEQTAIHSNITTTNIIELSNLSTDYFEYEKGIFIDKTYWNKFSGKFPPLARDAIMKSLVFSVGNTWKPSHWSILVEEMDQITDTIHKILVFFQEHNKLPDSEDLLLSLDVSPKYFDHAVQLINVNFDELIDFSKIDKNECKLLESQSLQVLSDIPLNEWTILKLFDYFKEIIFTAKIVMSYVDWCINTNVEELKQIYERIYSEKTNKSWDELALLILKNQSQYPSSLDIESISKIVNKGSLESKIIFNYTETLLNSTPVLPDSTDPEYKILEDRAREIARARKEGKIESGTDIIENCSIFEWRYLSEVVKATYYFSKAMELAKLSDTVTSTGLMKSYSTFESKAALKSEITDEREISLLEDLKKYKAIPTKSMTSILSVKEIELPKKIKDTLNHKMKNQSLVLRSDLLILEEIPPTDGFCQICGGEFEGDSFFQCVSCSRFVCTPHYIDLIAVGSAFCPNCRGDLFTLPFTCKGCELDFNQTKDFNIHKKKCPLCGYTLPSQEDLVKKRVGEKNSILKKDLPPTVDDKNAKKIWKGI